MLAQRSPQMRKAVGVLKELSADERARMLYESREMARMDFDSARDGAVREEREKWQGVLAEKDSENEQLRAQIAELQARLGNGN